MNTEDIVSDLALLDEQMLLADGFDDALIGYVRIFDKQIALYNEETCIELLIKQGMNAEEAITYFEYNVIGSYVGPYTPAFATIYRSVL